MTVRDIAAAAGVSITTVSRVLNGGAKVKPETRERVEAIIREGGYLRRERAVRPKPDKRVLIVMPATTDSRSYAHPTIHTILTGLTVRLRELGIDYTQYRLQETRESASGMLKAELDALGSRLYAAALRHAVPAGGALAVDRNAFAQDVTEQIEAEPRIDLRRQEFKGLQELASASSAVILATGPLTSDALAQ